MRNKKNDMKKKILISGGPVHAYLDPVKIITNRFRGGRMASMADKFARIYKTEVVYLTCKNAAQPENSYVNVIYHDGFDDYMIKIQSMAAEQDAIILGAAVVNLIPKSPLAQKFPSHNYQPGDVISIDFTIAPRIINTIKESMKKYGHLFGFKLLAGASHEILINAAYDIVMDSGATAVFANDVNDLDSKFAVAKDKSITRINNTIDMNQWIWSILQDRYYSTRYCEGNSTNIFVNGDCAKQEYKRLVNKYSSEWVEHKNKDNQIVFGTVAVRVGQSDAFITTTRGKKISSENEWVFVKEVEHSDKFVFVENKQTKATMNAPLLDYIFKNVRPVVRSIVHYHKQYDGLSTEDWAPPGTCRDSVRNLNKSFNIRGHGCFLLFDNNGMMIK